ncbi:MAG: hypothetical protein KGL39_26555 [Patescibacteria group bacterium]|nr:hypothetical protein [Patescibacteria group bacterium]
MSTSLVYEDDLIQLWHGDYRNHLEHLRSRSSQLFRAVKVGEACASISHVFDRDLTPQVGEYLIGNMVHLGQHVARGAALDRSYCSRGEVREGTFARPQGSNECIPREMEAAPVGTVAQVWGSRENLNKFESTLKPHRLYLAIALIDTGCSLAPCGAKDCSQSACQSNDRSAARAKECSKDYVIHAGHDTTSALAFGGLV